MHLVLTDRLTSFSVVPSIVVQEKVAASDIIRFVPLSHAVKLMIELLQPLVV
jgi:hypothetical protein